MLRIVVVIVAVMLVVGIGVFELVGTLAERKTRERFKKATRDGSRAPLDLRLKDMV